MKDDINKRLCELLAISSISCWWCPRCQMELSPQKVTSDEQCNICFTRAETLENPDFFSPPGRIYLLQRLKEKGCVYEYLARFAFNADFVSFLLDDNGALARAALEFLEEREASHDRN